VYARGELYLELLDRRSDAQALARALRDSDDADLRVLYEAYVARLEPRAVDRERLLRTLTAPSLLGPLQRQPAAERLLERDDAAGDLGPDPLAELAVHLDGRPSLLLRAAELSRRYYRDIALEERLDAAALALDAPQQLAHSAWFAGQAHDLDRLWEMATAASPAARRLALAELARRPDPDLERLAAAYAAEAPARREDIAFVLDHAEFLSGQRQEHARAAEQIQDLLERIGPSAAETAELQGRRSTYLRRAGEASAAWSALEPALASDRRPVLQEGVRILLELGYLERAESLARRMYERHPQELATWVVLAETLWQQDRFAEAADLLRDAQRAAPAAERSQLVPVAFADSFEASPLERTLRAWQHLLDVQLDIDLLIACIPEVHRRGQAETSAELAERIRAPAHAHAIYLAAYPSLLELHGARRTQRRGGRSPRRRRARRTGTAAGPSGAGSRGGGRSPGPRWSGPRRASSPASVRRCRRGAGSRRRRPSSACARAR